MTMTTHKVVLALICHPTNPDLFLGVSRKTNKSDFGLAGGKMESKETFRDALDREVKEETGVTITSAKPIFKRYNIDKGVRYLVTTFLCEVDTFDFSSEEEGIVKWVTKDDLQSGSFGNYNKKMFEALS